MIPRELCPKWDSILGGGNGKALKAQSAPQSHSFADCKNLDVASVRDDVQVSTYLRIPPQDIPLSPSSLSIWMASPLEQQTQGYVPDRLLAFDNTDWMAVGHDAEYDRTLQ